MAIEIIEGDCREVLKELPDRYVHCIVTSPPYFGLRDYGTASWAGSDPTCTHGVEVWEGPKQTQGAQSGHASKADRLARDQCRCGARRVDRQMGLEPTPDEFVEALVGVLREARRVLRNDGTLWLNLGDSYAGSWGNQGRKKERGTQRPINKPMMQNLEPYPDKKTGTGKIPEGSGLKPKDLIGIPWRVAFALQADGWYLRQDIIWNKPNPMPESVRDRCTKAHEYIFLLSKSPTYYFDWQAMQEPAVKGASGSKFNAGKTAEHQLGRSSDKPRRQDSTNESYVPGATEHSGLHREGSEREPETRNRRSVWTVTTKPFKEAHFATFPPDLIEPCVLAGCPEGGTVLDPFFGAGTTGLVCQRTGRDCIGIELNPGYYDIAARRLWPEDYAQAAE